MDGLRPEGSQHFANLAVAPRIVGWILATAIYGATLPLYGRYLGSPAYHRDGAKFRCLISSVMALLTVHTMLNGGELVGRGVLQDRTTAKLTNWWTIDCVAPVTHGLVALAVQCYLARRCCILLHLLHPGLRAVVRLLVAGLFCSLIFASFAAAVFLSVVGSLDVAGKPDHGTNPGFAVHMACSAMADCLISGTLIWALRKHQARGGGHSEGWKEEGLFRRVVRMAMRTAAYTAVVAFVGAVFALAFGTGSPYADLCMPFAFILPALYTCTLFSTTSLRHSDLTSSGLRPSISVVPLDLSRVPTLKPLVVPPEPTFKWGDGGGRGGGRGPVVVCLPAAGGEVLV